MNFDALLTAPPLLAATCCLSAALLAIAIIDARTMRIPDALSLPLVLIGLVVAAFFSRLSLLDHVIGAVVGYGALFVLALLYRRVRGRDGLGLGDAKLLAAAGAWLGWAALPSVVLIASFTGLGHALVLAVLQRDGGGKTALPFGPHLGFATWLVWVIGPLAAPAVWA